MAKDTKSKCIFAHAVQSKGPGEDRYAVNALVKDIKWLGYGRLGLKCDNEPAIVKLLEEVLVASRVRVVAEADQEFYAGSVRGAPHPLRQKGPMDFF